MKFERYESRTEKLASSAIFRRRLVRSGTVGLVMIAVSLGIGILGYEWLEKLSFIDAFVNACMILSGMGPLHNPSTFGGKLFAGLYALYSGLAVLVIAAIVFAPVIHRVLHRFHIQEAGDEDGPEKRPKRARK